jgi:hypothetical protein
MKFNKIPDSFETIKATKLFPEKVINNVSYNYCVQFISDKGNVPSKKIGEWVINNYSGNSLIFERGTQTGFYVINEGVPGSVQTITYQSTTGGNAVDSREVDRVYSPFNSMAQRGSLAHSRLVPGDSIILKKASKEHLLEIISTEAYGHSPSAVNYNAQDTNLVSYSENEGTGLVAHIDDIPGATINFDLPETGVSASNADYSDIRTLTRKIYNEDPEQLPVNLMLDADEYYYNPLSYEVRFSQSQSTARPVMTMAWWVMADNSVGIPQEDSSQLKISTGDYSGFQIEDGDFDETINILSTPATFRFGIPEGRGVYFHFNNIGIDDYGYRNNKNDPWSQAEIDISEITSINPNFIAVRVWRVGDRIRISIDNKIVFDQTAVLKGGMTMGVADTDLTPVIWNMGGANKPVDLFSFTGGGFGVYRFIQQELKPAAKMIIPENYTIDEVFNESAGSAMSSFFAKGRLRYRIVDDYEIRFEREAENDLIRVRFLRDAVPVPVPGFAFRIFDGQENFSEFDVDKLIETGLPFASNNLSKNKANWHDKAVIANPFNVSISPGDVVEGWRCLSFAPSDTVASFYYTEDLISEWNLKEWTLIPSSNYLFDAISGLLLIKKSFTLPTEFLIYGDFSKRYRSGQHREYFNEITKSIEHFDNLHANPGSLGGPGFDFSGSALQVFGHQEQELRYTESGEPAFVGIDWAFGQSKAAIHDWWVPSPAASDNYKVTKMGYFNAPNLWRDLFLRSNPPGVNVQTVVEVPGYPAAVRQSHGDTVADEGLIGIDLWGKPDPEKSYCGSPYEHPLTTNPGPSFSKYSVIGIRCARFDPGKLIYRLPRNSVILEAYVPLKFSNLGYQKWVWEGSTGPGGVSTKITLNDNIIIWEGADKPVDFTPEEYIEYVDEGDLTLDMFATYYDSQRVYQWNNSTDGNEFILPNKRIISGAELDIEVNRSTAKSGEWRMINCTRAMRQAYKLNDSLAQELFIAPSVGNPTYNVSQNTISNYLIGNLNTNTLTWTDGFPDAPTYTGVSSGRYFRWDDLDIGPILVRFRIGGNKKVYQLSIPAEVLLDD